MRIIVDGFGGDNAPLEVLKGCVRAVGELGVDITVVGNESAIRECAETNGVDISCLALRHAEAVMDVCAEPTKILKECSDTSMAVGLKMLADGEGDAFLSAGSTGALVVGATFIVKRIKGVKRTALATLIPTLKGNCLLLDSGANSDCRPEMLCQFGIMGSAYMSRFMNISEPRVGLANIGAEPSKGRDLEIEAYKLLSDAPINFVGNIEGRDIPTGAADVAVADGFTGNLILKTVEGMGKFFSANLKEMFSSGVGSKIGALLLMKKIKGFKKKTDYTEHGGAPLLGTQKPVIKAHGSSDAKAFYNAVRQAKICVENDLVGGITESICELKSRTDGQEEAEQQDGQA